jgi:hypothetical protein
VHTWQQIVINSLRALREYAVTGPAEEDTGP